MSDIDKRLWFFFPTQEQAEFLKSIKALGSKPNDWLRAAASEKIALEGGLKPPSTKWPKGEQQMGKKKIAVLSLEEHTPLFQEYVRSDQSLAAWLRYAIEEKRARDIEIKLPEKKPKAKRKAQPVRIPWTFKAPANQTEALNRITLLGGHPADWLREAINEKLSKDGGMKPTKKRLAGEQVKHFAVCIAKEQDLLFQKYKKGKGNISEWMRWAVEEKLQRQEPDWRPSQTRQPRVPRVLPPPKTARRRVEGGVVAMSLCYSKAQRHYLKSKKAAGDCPSRIARAALEMYMKAQEAEEIR